MKKLARLSERGVLLGWILLAVAVVMGTQSCSLMWAFANPAPHHWDNADYLNLEYNDSWAWRYGGPSPSHPSGYRGVWDSLINADHNRPPGYRIPALPFVYLGTPILPTLRGLSHLFFWATLGIVYLTCTTAVPGNAGRAAGLAAAILLSLYLTVGWAIRVFGTEYTLYFSVALMLLCLARASRADLNRHLTWIGLGFAMGLGVLSKFSFLTMAAPAGLLAFILIQNKQLPGLSLLALIGSVVIGAGMAYPWYRFHFFEAKNYGIAMTEFTRHSLNRSGLDLLASWFQLHIQEGMGVRAAWLWAGLMVTGLLSLVGRLTFSLVPVSGVFRRAGSTVDQPGSSLISQDFLFSRQDFSPPRRTDAEETQKSSLGARQKQKWNSASLPVVFVKSVFNFFSASPRLGGEKSFGCGVSGAEECRKDRRRFLKAPPHLPFTLPSRRDCRFLCFSLSIPIATTPVM